MITLGAAIHAAFKNRDWSKAERDSIEDVLDAAHAYATGSLPFEEAMRAGIMPHADGHRTSSSFARVRAMLASSPGDPRRASLKSMLNADVSQQMGVMTNHGFFSQEDLFASGITIKSRE